jgi:hypothetical protein
LMCTDIQMPGQMDGVGLAHAVYERWPESRSSWCRGTGTCAPRSSSPQQAFGKPLNAGK